jgi:hypothetical protein
MRLQDEAMVMTTIASVQDQVRAVKWTHTIDLGGGIVTPGR